MTALRTLVVAAAILLAVVLQLSLFSQLAVAGVVPDVVLVLVVALGLARGPEYAAVAGFFGGLLLDLAPPADHTAGRWALALVVVGWLAGMARRDSRGSALSTVAVVAAGSFVGTSLFALSGLVLSDPGVQVPQAFAVIGIALLYDVALTPLVVPLTLFGMRRLEPAASRFGAVAP